MKTSYESFGIECGKGWHDEIKVVIDYIENYNKDKNDDKKICILQIKEKFGGLRIYCNFYTNELESLIRNAEQNCEHICELCGSKENIGKTLGWITTCCKDCVKKMSEQRTFQTYKWKPYNCDSNIKWCEFKNGVKTIISNV